MMVAYNAVAPPSPAAGAWLPREEELLPRPLRLPLRATGVESRYGSTALIAVTRASTIASAATAMATLLLLLLLLLIEVDCSNALQLCEPRGDSILGHRAQDVVALTHDVGWIDVTTGQHRVLVCGEQSPRPPRRTVQRSAERQSVLLVDGRMDNTQVEDQVEFDQASCRPTEEQ